MTRDEEVRKALLEAARTGEGFLEVKHVPYESIYKKHLATTRRSLFSVGLGMITVSPLLVFFLDIALNLALDMRIRKQEAYLTMLAWPQGQIEFIESAGESPPHVYLKGVKCGQKLTIGVYVNGNRSAEYTMDKVVENWLYAELERRRWCRE